MKTGKIALVGFLAAALFVGFLLLPIRQWFTEFEGAVASLGALGPAVVVLVYILCTVLFIPGSAITIGAGTLFGLSTGFIVVVIGANLGALASFLLARSLLREKVTSWASANPKFRSLDQAIGKQGFKMVLLTRLSPVFPFVLLNYLLGLTAVRTPSYVLANLLGMLPATFLFVYIGAAARDALAGPADPRRIFIKRFLSMSVWRRRWRWSSWSHGWRAKRCARRSSSKKTSRPVFRRCSIRITNRRPTTKCCWPTMSMIGA